VITMHGAVGKIAADRIRRKPDTNQSAGASIAYVLLCTVRRRTTYLPTTKTRKAVIAVVSSVSTTPCRSGETSDSEGAKRS